MKLFAPALIFCGAIASHGQAPQVPHKMQFAGMTLTIRDDARREIQKDVDALTHSPKYFSIKVERAKTYFPIVERVFEEERLPLDFKYLALQESALVPDAVSTSNAVGFWQFKDFTAKEVGMRVDESIDERMNIASASRGAARYLKQCNHYFNNWVYALQAYQMGAGGVMRVVGDRDLGSRNVEITSETYWYVKKFLAHKVAFENALEGKPQIEVVMVPNAAGRTLAEIAGEVNLDEQQLKDFNKWLKTDRIPSDKEYVVLVPKGAVGPEFNVLTVASAAQATVAPTVPAAIEEEINGVPVIRAHQGETVSMLALRGGIGINKFLSYNEMDIDRPIVQGQLYFLDRKKKKGPQELYTTMRGEDIWMISQRFGVRQKSLLKYNDLQEGEVTQSGTTLFLASAKPGHFGEASDSAVAVLDEGGEFEWDLSLSPSRNAEGALSASMDKPAPASKGSEAVGVPGAGAIHEVKPADTLYSVARQYGVTIKEVMEWNDKKDFALSVGERLRVSPR